MHLFKNKKAKIRFLTALSAVFVFFMGVFLFDEPRRAEGGQVLGESYVHTFISGSLEFKVYPEKRIPKTGNWDTFADIVMRDCNTGAVAYEFLDIPTDTEGIGVIDQTVGAVAPGSYRIEIIGASHLRKVFDCYEIDSSEEFVDLTLSNELLLAGEVSNVFDNYINSLDISVLVNQLYTSEYYSDLNQDSKVNGLDISIQVYNLFRFGDV